MKPKYQKGRRIVGGYDRKGNMVLPVTNDRGINNVTLPETTITPKNNMNLATHIDKGKRNFLQTSKELITPIVIGAGIAGLGAGLATSPLLTLGSTASGIGGSYVGGKVGENVNKGTNNGSNYKQLGELFGGILTGAGTVLAPRAIARDAYTTVGGKFGYYGNPVQRVWHTLGRNRNWNVKAKHPELLRKLKQPAEIDSNGTVQVSNPNPRTDFARTNFTTDRPVVSHGSGNWDMADLMIFDPKITKGMKPISIEPSDMFYVGNNITAKPNQVTLVSGNKAALTNANNQGMSTLSSSKLRQIWDDMHSEYLGNLTTYSKMSPIQKKLAKRGFEDNVSYNKREDYAREIQRLQTKRGTPTIKDYVKLERETGLDAGVIGIDELNPKIIDKYMRPNVEITYPNGRILDSDYFYPQTNTERVVLNRMPYNKVFYDPSSHIESEWALAKGFK